MTKQVICFNCSGRGFVNRSTEKSMWSEQCEECHGSGVMEVPMTNFDRIKNMSIDEMAELMFKMVDCVSCQNKLMNNGDFRGTKQCNDKDFYAMCNGDGRKCLEVCKKWLESEVSE